MDAIYLDYAATTPLDPRVREAMEPYLESEYGNPSSIHRLGQRARMAIDQARETVAEIIEIEPVEVIFVSGGTEANNAAIRGTVAAAPHRRHVVTTAIEHESVLEVCHDLEERHGCEVTYVPPDRNGVVAADEIERAIRPDTALVTVMHANNETGSVQPVERIGEVCRCRGIPFHSDTVQTAGSLDVSVSRLPAGLLSLSAHKFYGPKGIGVLVLRKGTPWWPQQLGGGQERQRRSGTENVPGIVGLARALELAVAEAAATRERLSALRERLLTLVSAGIPDVEVNAALEHCLPGTINLSVPGISGEALVMALDQRGIMVSTGSACSSGSTEPSHVLLAMGRTPQEAGRAVRVTLGRTTSVEEVEAAGHAIVATAGRLRPSEEPAVAAHA